MLIQKKKRYLLSAFVFLFLCVGTGVGFILLKNSQDVRQQASGVCKAGDPYCSCDSWGSNCVTVDENGARETVKKGSEENNKGILSTSYTGERPVDKATCSSGVWMNEFCYMPGDEIAGGYIVVKSGRHDYPYLEQIATYESLGFGAKTVTEKLGTTESLGNDCGGKGQAYGGVCYAYGSVIDGYLVMPARTSGCNDSTGDYCYAHLEKIEVSYSDWQTALATYEKDGNIKTLEDLYKKTYGISFNPGALYDPSAPNATLLKTQALLSALTSAEVLQKTAEEQNKELDKKGSLTKEEQATYDFNKQIINSPDLAKNYQILDQLNDAAAQKIALNNAIQKMYSDLVVAGDNTDLSNLATAKFKEIFGYDPSSKYGNVNGILGAFGIDSTQLNKDRENYVASIEQQKEDIDKLNQEYQGYVGGNSQNINDLKQAALDAGLVTNDQIKGLSETDLLALLLSKFSDTTLDKAKQEAAAIVTARETSVKEQELTKKYLDNQNSITSISDLRTLYKIYVGHEPDSQTNIFQMREEIAKHNSQIALSTYAQTQNISYLNNYLKNNTDLSGAALNKILDDPKALLNNIYGAELGGQLYKDIVVPNSFNEAMKSFSDDKGAALTAFCKELGVTDCNITDKNATTTLSLILDKMYEGNNDVSIPDLAASYSNQIISNTKDDKQKTILEIINEGIVTGNSSQVAMYSGTDTAYDDYESNAADLNKVTNEYRTAVEAGEIFNASQAFSYATENRAALSNYTWGLSYGNALMEDDIFNREFTIKEMDLNAGQSISLTFNQITSQVANVDVAQNIATNYATSKLYDYTGPADTKISDVALKGAENLGVLDYNYQSAEAGYYTEKTLNTWGEKIGELATKAGAAYAASQMNQSAITNSLYLNETYTYVDPIEYAKQAGAEFTATYHENMVNNLYENYVAAAEKNGVDKVTFEQFIEDPEVQRSSKELDYERLEKVVAPAAAVVVLPALVLSGVGVPVILGAASSAFSLYQGAGMKAQALEIQRIDIDTRENAMVQSYIENGESEEEIANLKETLKTQVETLNKQGNLMLANSAVAAFTSAGGLLSSIASTANAANAASSTVNFLTTSGQVLTKVGQVGGIAMNSYNAVNSGISSYNAFSNSKQIGDNKFWEGVTSAASSFVAASGVAGNTFGVLGPTTYTNKIDYILDAANVPAGAGLDIQQVSQACFGDSGAFSKEDCTNAWIGLALSAGQNVSQISSSVRNYKADLAAGKLNVDAGRVAEIQKQIDAIDTEVLALKTNSKGLSTGLQINDLALQRATLLDQIVSINPNVKLANNTTEDYLATGARISSDLETKAQAAIDAGRNAEAERLIDQAEIYKNRPLEAAAIKDQIASIDEQITKKGLLLSNEEVADLQTKRSDLTNKLETVVKDLSAVETMQKQSAELLQTAKENTAFEALKKLQAVDTQKAELVKIYSPSSDALAKYQTKLGEDNAAAKLETDSSERLKSIAALQDNLAKLTDLETQRNALANSSNADADAVREEIARFDTEISKMKEVTDSVSSGNRSFIQKVADAISPNKAKNEAYYKSLDLTREAETIKTKLTNDLNTETETQSLKEQLAAVNRQLIDQKYVLAGDAANPSKNIIQRVAEIVPNMVANRQVNDLKNAAKKLGTNNLKLAENIANKQAEIEKLKTEDAVKNQAEITKLETELADLSKTAQNYLKGETALINVNRDGDFTEYVVTKAGEDAGIKQKQLDVLNKELAAFEDFRRQGQTAEEIEKNGPFKIYSGTDSFKDQDIFLLAEVEAFGAGRRGSVFGALPGMGKTDVVMPFNILFKQRLTNEPQFVVFPEAKLMKPWVSDANYTPNKTFIDYVESRFGVGSVLIVKANDSNIDPAAIAKAKFVITTKDVAFDLQNTDTQVGLALRNQWRKSFVHADEVDWTFNPNENYKLSGTQTALTEKSEFSLYLNAQKQVLGIDEKGNLSGQGLSSLRNLVNQLETSKSIPDGIVRTSDGKGGKFADATLEKQVLSEWLGTWNGQSKIAGLDMSADIATVRQKINNYLSTDTDAQTHNHRAELAMINETVNFLSRVPGEDYGLTTNTKMNGDTEETINSIAPKEQNRDTGRSYSAVAESLLYNTLGARVVGANGQIDLAKLTVGENGSDINYALLMLESKGFSLYTGTPETVAKLYKMAYGIELKVFTDSAVDDSIRRFKESDSKVFTDLESQIAARLDEERDQVFVNMVAGLRSNEATLKDLVTKVSAIDTDNVMYEKLMLIGASGKLTEYDLVAGELKYVREFVSTDDLNARTAELNNSDQLYIKFYEYGAHIGVDTKNNVDLSRAVGLCRGCDETTFAQGINRLRVQVANDPANAGKLITKSAPMDVVWLDAPTGKTDVSIDDFAVAIKDQQVINEALAEVSFKETLLKNSVDATFADLVDLAKNGKKGLLGFGAYKADQNLVTQLEAAQQKWKETSQMNYMLGSDDLSAQAKLEKTASQVAGTYEELNKLVAGSGEPAKLLAKQADGAIGDKAVKLAFSGDDDYKVLGEKPSYRQIVELINQSSKHLENVNIAFTNRSSQQEVVQSEIAKAVDNAQTNTPARTAEENANQNILQRTSQAIVQGVNSTTVQRVIRTPVNLVSSAFNAITGLFKGEEEIAPEVAVSKDKAINDLKITDEQTLANLEDLKTTEEIANFVAERQAAYKKLQDQFAALNTVKPTVNNEEDYKASSDTLAETLATIQDLQDKSGLAFIAIADDDSISRVNEDQFKNLSTFRARAEVQAEKLAKEAEQSRITAEAEKAKLDQEEKDKPTAEELNKIEQERLAQEAVNKLAAEQLALEQATYKKLQAQFAALNTVKPVINNQDDYQAQSDKLAETLATVQDLQDQSGLAFIAIADDGSISRVNEDQFANLSTFKTKAEEQIKKLAQAEASKKAEQAEQAEQERITAEAEQNKLAEEETARLAQEEKDRQDKENTNRLALEEANRIEQERIAAEAERQRKLTVRWQAIGDFTNKVAFVLPQSVPVSVLQKNISMINNLIKVNQDINFSGINTEENIFVRLNLLANQFTNAVKERNELLMEARSLVADVDKANTLEDLSIEELQNLIAQTKEEIQNEEKNKNANLRLDADELSSLFGSFDFSSDTDFIDLLEKARNINKELGDEEFGYEIRFNEKMASLGEKYGIDLSILRFYVDLNSLLAVEKELDFYLAQLKAWGIDEVDGYNNLAEMFIRYSDGDTDLSEVMKNVVLKDHQQVSTKSQLSYFVTNADGQFLDENGDVLDLDDVSQDRLPVKKAVEDGGYANYRDFLQAAEAKNIAVKRERILDEINFLLGNSLAKIHEQENLLKLLMEKGSEALTDEIIKNDSFTWRIEELDKLNKQASNKTTARQSAVDFVDNWLSEHPVLANIKDIFPDFSPGMVNKDSSSLEDNLKGKPAYNAAVLGSLISYDSSSKTVDINLDDIIGSSSLFKTGMPDANNWWDVLIHQDNIHRYVSMTINNGGDEALKGIELIEIGNGKYAVGGDGNTRTAILKALGVKTAKLEVRGNNVLGEHLIAKESVDALTERKDQGLWTGEIYQENDSYYIRVDSYTNPWVFLAGWETLRDDFNVDVSNVKKNTGKSAGRVNGSAWGDYSLENLKGFLGRPFDKVGFISQLRAFDYKRNDYSKFISDINQSTQEVKSHKDFLNSFMQYGEGNSDYGIRAFREYLADGIISRLNKLKNEQLENDNLNQLIDQAISITANIQGEYVNRNRSGVVKITDEDFYNLDNLITKLNDIERELSKNKSADMASELISNINKFDDIEYSSFMKILETHFSEINPEKLSEQSLKILYDEYSSIKKSAIDFSENYKDFVKQFNELIEQANNMKFGSSVYVGRTHYYSGSSTYNELNKKIAERQEVYQQVRKDFLKLDLEVEIKNEDVLEEELANLTKIIEQISAQEKATGKKFFEDGAQKRYDEAGELAGYKFERASFASSYTEFIKGNLDAVNEEITSEENNNIDSEEPNAEKIDKDFNSLCSDCNQVRLDTQVGVEIADSLTKEAEELAKQADAARVANNQDQAADLSNQAQAKQQAALDQLNDTRFKVANSHGMQNQCVQLYLNAWVDTREAVIRNTQTDIDKAINSVYQATVIAENLLAAGSMEITTENGFLSIGQQKETITLSAEEINDVTDLLKGNAEENIVGLKEMAQFEQTDGQSDKEVAGGILGQLKNSAPKKSLLPSIKDRARVFSQNIGTSLQKSFSRETSQTETVNTSNNAERINIFHNAGVKISDFFYNTYFKEKVEESLNVITGYGYNPTPNQRKHAWMILNLFGENYAVTTLIESFSSGSLVGNDVTKAWEVIDKKADANTATTLAEQIRYGYLIGDNLEKALKIIEQKGDAYTAISLINAISNVRFSDDNLVTTLNFVTRDSIANTKIATALANIISNDYLTGDNLAKAWKVISQKGDTETASVLANNISDGRLVGYNLATAFDFVIRDDLSNASVATALANAIFLGRLNDNNLIAKAWKVIEQKGDAKTAIDLANAINGRFTGDNLAIALNFVIRDDLSNASIATALANAIRYGYLADDNLVKAWDVIEQKGDARTASALVNAISSGHLTSNDSVKAWKVIEQKGDTETASVLTHAIINSRLGGENLITALNFVTRDDISNASIATDLVNIIRDNYFAGDNLTKALKIIDQKGDADTATALLSTIYNGHLTGEELTTALNFVTRDDIINSSIATALANVIYSGRFTDDNLKKTLKIIEQKGDADTATALINAIYSGNLTDEVLSTSLNIAYKKGDANTVTALAYAVFNGRIAGENLTTALNFVIKNDAGNTSIATDLASAISNGRLIDANLTTTLNFVTTRNNASDNASIATDLANAISRGRFVSENLTTALNFVIRDDVITAPITATLADAIYLGHLVDDNLEKALKAIDQKGDANTATALAIAIYSGHLVDANLVKAWNIIEQKAGVNTATVLANAVIKGRFADDNLAKAWKIIDQKGNADTAMDLANAIIHSRLTGDNLVTALNFVNRYDISNASIIAVFTHAISSGNLTGDNLVIVLDSLNKNRFKNTSISTISEKNIPELDLDDATNIESLHKKINNDVADINTELEYISNVLSQKNITVDNKGMFFSKVVLLVFGDNIPSRLQAPAKLTAWRVYNEVQKGEEITSQKLLNLIYRAKDAIQQQLNEVSDDSLSNMPAGYRVSIGNEVEVISNGLSRTGLFNLRDYMAYKKLLNQLNSAGASSAQIVQDQIAIYEEEFTFDSLNQAKSVYKEVASKLSDLGIGSGNDGTHEFANYPVSDSSALIWEYSELERLGFLSLNPQVLQWIGERGIHITISGEQGIKSDENVVLFQNSLLMTGYTSAVLNGQAGIQDAEEKSAETTDISGNKVSTEYSIARHEYVRFRPSVRDIFTDKPVSGVEFRVNSISSLLNLQKTLRAYNRLSIPLMTYQNALSNKEFDEKTLLEDMNNVIDDPTLFNSIILNNEENKFLLPTVEDTLKRKMILTWAYYRTKSIFNFEQYQISNLLPSPLNPLVSKTLKVMDGELGKVFPTTEEGTSRLLDDAFASFHHSPPPNSLPGQMQSLVDEVLNGIDSLPEFKSEAGTVAYSDKVLSIQGLNNCSSCSLRINTVLNQLDKANELLTKGNIDEAINIIGQARNYVNSHQYKNTLVQDIQNKDIEVEEVNAVKTKAEQDDALKAIQLIIDRVNDLLKTRKDLTPEQITALNTLKTELETEKTTVSNIQVKPSSLLEYLEVDKKNISSAIRRLTYVFNSGSRQAEDEKLEQNYRLTYPLQVKTNKGADNFSFDDSGKAGLTKIDFSKLRTVGGVISSFTVNGLNAIGVWFKSLIKEESITVTTTEEPMALISVTPAISITVTTTPTPTPTKSPTPTSSPTPTPSPSLTPSPTPKYIISDIEEESFWQRIIQGLADTNLIRSLKIFSSFLISDLFFRGVEIADIYYISDSSKYKGDLPKYDPESKESQELAALGIYEDYLCKDGDAYSQDLTKTTDNLTKMADCQNGCYKGACLAKVGDSCAREDENSIFAASNNKCLLSCESGKLVESNACGHVKVDAYSNKAYWEVYQSLGFVSEQVLNDIKVYMYATWYKDLEKERAANSNLITVGSANATGVNIKPAIIAGGHAKDQDTVIHEYFHLWGGQQHRLYPDWAPFSVLVSSAETWYTSIVSKSSIDAVPGNYIELLDYKVDKYVSYNDKGNIFHYGEDKYPVVNYSDLNSEQIEIGEDFAESAAWYVVNSCELKEKSPIRYDYFRDTIFNGVEYTQSGGCND